MSGSGGSDGSDVQPVPGVVAIWIVVVLAIIVGAGWAVKIAATRKTTPADPVSAGAAPLTALPPSSGAPNPSPGTSTRPGPTASTTGAPGQGTAGRAGSVTVQVAASWVDGMARRTGIPARALTAYADAQLTMDAKRPSCHLSWVMLAGIAKVESGHGSHGGAVLMPDGTTSIPILGPPLDGTHGNKAIHATPEGVRLDGDTRWDHAVGPMQFLPSTWAHWGVSAGGGAPNPSDIDDAVLTAADYLCSHGRNLATVEGWRSALAAYNAPDSYAAKVTSVANGYARASLG